MPWLDAADRGLRNSPHCTEHAEVRPRYFTLQGSTLRAARAGPTEAARRRPEDPTPPSRGLGRGRVVARSHPGVPGAAGHRREEVWGGNRRHPQLAVGTTLDQCARRLGHLLFKRLHLRLQHLDRVVDEGASVLVVAELLLQLVGDGVFELFQVGGASRLITQLQDAQALVIAVFGGGQLVALEALEGRKQALVRPTRLLACGGGAAVVTPGEKAERTEGPVRDRGNVERRG